MSLPKYFVLPHSVTEVFLIYSRAEHCRRGSDIVCSAAVVPFTVVSSPGIKFRIIQFVNVQFEGFVNSLSKFCFKLDAVYH